MNKEFIVDSHCHLDFDSLFFELNDVLKEAKKTGVKKMLTICTNFNQLKRVEKICADNKEVVYATGIHPNEPEEALNFDQGKLSDICRSKNLVGVGETGLDFHYSKSTQKQQIFSLIKHIEVAKEHNLPLIIHARDADAKIKEILTNEYKKGAFNCVMHCFSSSSYLADAMIELGFYLSMSGIITFNKSNELRDIFSRVPLNKIIIETDSPYLAPVPHRGKRNEPSYVSYIAKKGAEVLKVEEELFRKETTRNFYKLFTKAREENEY